MITVVVPADEAATLLPRPLAMSDGYPGLQADVLGHHPPTRRFVVHTANIDPTPCKTCGGNGSVEGRNIASWDACWSCDGEGTVPAVVTLAVPCETCKGSGWRQREALHRSRYCPNCTDGFRPVGTATVTHCWPIMPAGAWPKHGKVVEEPVEGNLHLVDVDDLSYIDITGQIVGNPQPGMWLLELDAPAPVDVYGTSTAPPTTTPPGGGSAVVGVSAITDTPTTNTEDGGGR